jgi:hypothetical protein
VVSLSNSTSIEINSRSTAFCHALDFECVAIVQPVIAWALLEGCLLKWPIFVLLVANGHDQSIGCSKITHQLQYEGALAFSTISCVASEFLQQRHQNR